MVDRPQPLKKRLDSAVGFLCENKRNYIVDDNLSSTIYRPRQQCVDWIRDRDELVLPLRLGDWPRHRNGRRMWPTVLTYDEYLEVSQKNYSYEEYSFMRDKKQCFSVTLADANKDLSLLTSVLNLNLVGVREDVKIPKHYLGFFRRRWGMLLLTNSKLPPGLVRFLTGLWKSHPYSLWLHVKLPLKNFLRVLPRSMIHRSGGEWHCRSFRSSDTCQ